MLPHILQAAMQNINMLREKAWFGKQEMQIAIWIHKIDIQSLSFPVDIRSVILVHPILSSLKGQTMWSLKYYKHNTDEPDD